VTLVAAASAGKQADKQKGRISMRPFFCPTEPQKIRALASPACDNAGTKISQNVNITAAFFHSDNG
jgi:hypothetical protein